MTTTSSTRRRIAVLAGLAALGVLGVLGAATLLPSLAGADPSDRPPGTQFRSVGDGSLPEDAPRLRPADAPLSVDERGYAIHLAQEAMPAGATDVLGRPGGEVLAADLPPLEDRGGGRRATVSLYDYDSDRLHQALVDLSAGSVRRSDSVRELQLPPTVAESAIATQLALAADPAPAFLAQYRQMVGAPLLATEQVQVVAGVWRPADADAAIAGPARACGVHRCLQLLIALPSGQYLDTRDFAVDLSSRTVLRVAPTGPEQDHDH